LNVIVFFGPAAGLASQMTEAKSLSAFNKKVLVQNTKTLLDVENV
jgi:hypothetical protein